ncbi:MAG: hypothetical protein R3F46_03630 [bacterium]
MYTIRNQVVDADDNIAYGDSLPIHLGHGGAGGGGGDTEIVIIRNDGGDFQLNLDALTADLDALGASYSTVDFSGSVADDFAGNPNAKVAIWYRGGPGGAGESATFTTAWTASEIDNYIQLMDDGFGVLLMSQNHGYDGDLAFINGWNGIYGYATLPSSVPDADRRMPWASSLCTDDGIGFGGTLGFIPTAPSNFIGNPSGANFGADGTNAAERYTGSGSSGELPISFGMPTGRQYCGIGYSAPPLRVPAVVRPSRRVSATSRTRWASTWASCPGVTARHRTRTSASSRATATASHRQGVERRLQLGGHERDGFGLRLDEPCGRAEQHPGLAG